MLFLEADTNITNIAERYQTTNPNAKTHDSWSGSGDGGRPPSNETGDPLRDTGDTSPSSRGDGMSRLSS